MVDDMPVSNPFDLINAFIDTGKATQIQTKAVEDGKLLEELRKRINLDSLQTSHLTLSEYENAIDTIKIRPSEYFSLSNKPGKIGLQLTIYDLNALKRAYNLFETYKDPRIRETSIINGERIMEAIIKEGKFEAMQDGPINIEVPLSKIRIPPGMRITSVSDIPSLEWRRVDEDIQLVSQMLLLTMVAILKKGWMVNPELIRLLNLVKPEILDSLITDMSIFVKSRIVVALQRLADILYLTNFGALDETIHFHLIEDMFDNPLEDRTNMPQSEASDVVDFLNDLREYPEIDKLAILSRRIGVLTKPVSEESPNFIGFNASGDAIREVLSVIHYTMNNQNVTTQIHTMYSMVTDLDFREIIKYYFDPSYELLHTPLLTMIQATIERMEVLLYGKEQKEGITSDKIVEMEEMLAYIINYLTETAITGQFVEIWSKLNRHLSLDPERLIEKRSRSDIYELIKGKTIVLNIMTPLLLAKYEKRGFNPLAANINEQLESHLKNITGIIAVGANLTTKDLENLMDTMFVEAPELKKQSVDLNSNPPGPPKPTGPPKPSGPPKPGSSGSDNGSHLIPTKMGIELARIANEYVTGGGERNLHRALVELIRFTKSS